jgi:hypothetical protein
MGGIFSPRARLRAAAILVVLIGSPRLALAENGDGPAVRYASLPGVQHREPTGSLPATDSPTLRNLSAFSDQVERGTIVVRESAPTRCLPGDLLDVVADVAGRFGAVSIESTHRTRARNQGAGGARHSLHLSCRAIDFRVRTRTRAVMAYLGSRREVGGLKVYRNGIIHIDNGERRSW